MLFTRRSPASFESTTACRRSSRLASGQVLRGPVEAGQAKTVVIWLRERYAGSSIFCSRNCELRLEERRKEPGDFGLSASDSRAP
jgi:hypothetical protein